MLKITTQRKILLDYLKKKNTPESAEMIFLNLPNGAMNLSTVYRNLDKFYEHHLVEKYQLGNIFYYKLVGDKHKHYMVCDKCGALIEIDCHLSSYLDLETKKHDFKVRSHDLTIYGLCSNCH